MDKKILIDLFERRDKKRKRILYELYFDLINSRLTARYIAETICKDLGRADMVNAADIKFCRFQFKGKVASAALKPGPRSKPVSASSVQVEPSSQSSGSSAHWSDPDTMSTQENIIVESKFSKK
ncbi:hypothetical protein L0657_23455 [Dyadobacter sp. CY345]|uniref:hypothetical protein n=1 Tax=Dyadobacter sp. CY345 TaxID=2909335 RepID=UPI001F357426|nr:hypothetical protein [Dyadobacter sp. CY345]MCF2446931.1 hypothetical protein [Dyadobacter sp. CY345]